MFTHKHKLGLWGASGFHLQRNVMHIPVTSTNSLVASHNCNIYINHICVSLMDVGEMTTHNCWPRYTDQHLEYSSTLHHSLLKNQALQAIWSTICRRRHHESLFLLQRTHLENTCNMDHDSLFLSWIIISIQLNYHYECLVYNFHSIWVSVCVCV